MMDLRARWERYKKDLCVVPSVGFSVDISRMGPDDAFFERMKSKMAAAYGAMDALEDGAIANPDEGRQVGHYWLRDPDLSPTPAIRLDISGTLQRIHTFTGLVHAGTAAAKGGEPFTDVLVIGIGGSALGPQFVADALGNADDPLAIHFFDNTDPDGFDRVIARLGERLATTLVLVVSKSGGTKETRNGMIEARLAMEDLGVHFPRHAVAITQEGSALDQLAAKEGWLARFPMWDWVGGRTSELSAVGLLPAALQGFDIDAMLAGARDMDVATRVHDTQRNPAALLALAWHFAGEGRGAKDMVVLPYKDRLMLFSRYLQQLVMESLGKEKDLEGKVVNQGIAVYGNKGSTDQHAYVQQLRDGVKNFFVTFIEVLQNRNPDWMPTEVEPGVGSGDYLLGFMLGTRRALYESGRPSLTITIPDVSPRSVGALIALFERAVGFYGALVGINAYHQPGVEAGKKAATEILDLQPKILAQLTKVDDHAQDAEQIAKAIGTDDVETVFKICEHLAANGSHEVMRLPDPEDEGPRPYWAARFWIDQRTFVCN